VKEIMENEKGIWKRMRVDSREQKRREKIKKNE